MPARCQPYAGRSDRLTAYLRRRFRADADVDVELEINQQQVLSDSRQWRRLRGTVARTLLQAAAGV